MQYDILSDYSFVSDLLCYDKIPILKIWPDQHKFFNRSDSFTAAKLLA